MTGQSTASTIPSRTAENTAQRFKTPISAVVRFPGVFLDKLTSWNNWANPGTQAHIKSDVSYRDISSSSGDGQTDYSKPVWRR